MPPAEAFGVTTFGPGPSRSFHARSDNPGCSRSSSIALRNSVSSPNRFRMYTTSPWESSTASPGKAWPKHQAVASGSADCGLGTEAAARAQGLDFVPLASERYYLACLKSALDQPAVMALRQVLGALRRQADPPRGSVQQTHLQVLLKILDAAGDRRGWQRERLRRLDKASCFSHTYENLHRLNTIHDG